MPFNLSYSCDYKARIMLYVPIEWCKNMLISNMALSLIIESAKLEFSFLAVLFSIFDRRTSSIEAFDDIKLYVFSVAYSNNKQLTHLFIN